MAARVDLWEAINRYAEACGGNTGDATVGDARMDAVAAVERAVDALVVSETQCQEEERCPGCLGSGRFESACCNGANGCSCRGDIVDMGACRVCGGRGQVVAGQFNPRANLESIAGMMYLGTGPRSGHC